MLLTPYIAVHRRASGTASSRCRTATVTLHLEVDDVDGLVEAMVGGGAVLDRAPEGNPVGRVAVVRDPFGHRWFLNRPAAARTP